MQLGIGRYGGVIASTCSVFEDSLALDGATVTYKLPFVVCNKSNKSMTGMKVYEILSGLIRIR